MPVNSPYTVCYSKKFDVRSRKRNCSFLPVILLNCEMRVKFSYSSIHLSCMQPFHTHQYFTQIFFFGMNRIETCILHNKCYEAVRKCYEINYLFHYYLVFSQWSSGARGKQMRLNKVNRLIELFYKCKSREWYSQEEKKCLLASFGSFVKNLWGICRIFLFNV